MTSGLHSTSAGGPSAIRRPKLSTVIRSATCSIRLMSWSITRMVSPCPLRRFRSWTSWFFSTVFRPAPGSSRSSSWGCRRGPARSQLVAGAHRRGSGEAEARASAASAVLEISREDFASMVQAKGGKRPWVDAYVTHRALQTMIRRFEIVSDLNTEDARRWLAR